MRYRGTPLNPLKRLWAQERCALGAIATIPSVEIIQILAAMGLDFVLIDMEHAPIGPAEASRMIAATSGTGLAPLVRVSTLSPEAAKAPLDFGAMGICFPFVNTPADAETAARAVRYPPNGDRGWGPFYAPMRWGLSMRDYQDAADSEIVAMATLEAPAALDAIDALLATPGLDCVCLGLGDLATALGHRGRIDHPEVQAAAARMERAARGTGIALGGAAASPEEANAMIARGYRLISLGFDWALLQRGVQGAMAGVAR